MKFLQKIFFVLLLINLAACQNSENYWDGKTDITQFYGKKGVKSKKVYIQRPDLAKTLITEINYHENGKTSDSTYYNHKIRGNKSDSKETFFYDSSGVKIRRYQIEENVSSMTFGSGANMQEVVMNFSYKGKSIPYNKYEMNETFINGKYDRLDVIYYLPNSDKKYEFNTKYKYDSDTSYTSVEVQPDGDVLNTYGIDDKYGNTIKYENDKEILYWYMYDYDAKGNIIDRIDAVRGIRNTSQYYRGKLVQQNNYEAINREWVLTDIYKYVYNEKGHQTLYTYQDRSSIRSSKWVYQYNEQGLKTEIKSIKNDTYDGKELYKYNKEGLIINKKELDENDTLTKEETFKYDDRGVLIFAIGENKEKAQTRESNYDYNKNGLLEKQTSKTDGKVTYEEIYEYEFQQ